MKKLILVLFVFLISPHLLKAETATIITKENAIREDCRFFSPIRAKVRYYDVIKIISMRGDWYRVNFQGIEGCIHRSAIEKRSFSLSKVSGVTDQSASGDEVALAGKGFNPQVESEYRGQNPGLNYGTVDRVETYTFSEIELREFISEGKLKLP